MAMCQLVVSQTVTMSANFQVNSCMRYGVKLVNSFIGHILVVCHLKAKWKGCKHLHSVLDIIVSHTQPVCHALSRYITHFWSRTLIHDLELYERRT